MLEKQDKRDRARVFRQRLHQAMARDAVSRAALARATGVDRSTIGQLLAEDDTRLPGGQLLADLAAALTVSSDWLLGLSDRPERPGDLLSAAVRVTGAERSSADEQIIDWHREADGYKIRHVPATLPDLLKTEEVIRWEYQGALTKTPDQAVAAMKDMASWLDTGLSDYEIAVPIHALNALATGTGYYAGLDRTLRLAQLDHMSARCETLFPSLRLFLFDARQVFSAPMTVFGPRLAVLYVGRFYLAFRDLERLRSLTQHFDWLVREAQVDARDVASYLRTLAKDA